MRQSRVTEDIAASPRVGVVGGLRYFIAVPAGMVNGTSIKARSHGRLQKVGQRGCKGKEAVVFHLGWIKDKAARSRLGGA
jgi:hypothetical protein